MPSAADATICAARAMHVASPTDVPPNFITCKGFVIAIRFEVILNDSVSAQVNAGKLDRVSRSKHAQDFASRGILSIMDA